MPLTESTSADITFDVTHPAWRDDRYGYFERCRVEADIHVQTVTLGGTRTLRRYYLLDYASVQRLMTSEAATRRPAPGPIDPDLHPVAAFVFRWVVFQDPPDHGPLRRLMQPAFSAPRLRALEHRIGYWIDDRLQAIDRPVDVIGHIAVPLPLLVLCDILGLAHGDLPRLQKWSAALTPMLLDPTQAPDRPDPEMLAAVADALDDNRGADTLLGRLRQAVADGQLSRDAAVANAMFLVWAGHETTARLIGNLVWLLLKDPAALARLRQAPDLVPVAVNEALRLESPIQLATRWASADLDLGQTQIPAGSLVTPVLAAANRDPMRFARPHHFDLDRPLEPIASFGFGAHYCLGDRLARLETQLLLQQLLARFPRWQALDTTPDWDPAVALRGLGSLTVDFGPSA